MTSMLGRKPRVYSLKSSSEGLKLHIFQIEKNALLLKAVFTSTFWDTFNKMYLK